MVYTALTLNWGEASNKQIVSIIVLEAEEKLNEILSPPRQWKSGNNFDQTLHSRTVKWCIYVVMLVYYSNLSKMTLASVYSVLLMELFLSFGESLSQVHSADSCHPELLKISTMCNFEHLYNHVYSKWIYSVPHFPQLFFFFRFSFWFFKF